MCASGLVHCTWCVCIPCELCVNPYMLHTCTHLTPPPSHIHSPLPFPFTHALTSPLPLHTCTHLSPSHMHSPLLFTHALTSPLHTCTHLSPSHMHSPLPFTHALTSPFHTCTHLFPSHMHSPLPFPFTRALTSPLPLHTCTHLSLPFPLASLGPPGYGQGGTECGRV